MTDAFNQYIQHGWVLVPIPPGTKGPTSKGWNDMTAPQRAIPPGWNAGVLHARSGTCVLDIDHYLNARDEFLARGINLDALAIHHMAVHSGAGRENRDKLWFRLSTPLPTVKLFPYKLYKEGKAQTFHAIEFRCGTANGGTVQDVIPPSMHPETGRPYEWSYADDMVGDWKNLPELPPELLELWKANCESHGEQAAQEAPAAPPTARGVELDALEKLLNRFDPDAPYDDWIRALAAVHHESEGSEDGFQLAVEWSRRGAKFKGPDDVLTHWRSFHVNAENAVTIGSLLSEKPAELSEFSTVDTDPGDDTRPWSKAKRLEDRLIFVDLHGQYFDKTTGAFRDDHNIMHRFTSEMPELEIKQKDGSVKYARANPVSYLKSSETKQIVHAVAIHPGEGEFFEERGRRFYNRYAPPKVELLRAKSHEMAVFKFLWDRIDDPVLAAWLMKFFAHAVQKPGIKILSAPLLYGKQQGTGKTTLMFELPKVLFGYDWVKEMTNDTLKSQFNATLAETWWVYLDELKTQQRADRDYITNKIKPWITNSGLEITRKGKDPVSVPNRAQLTATSNFDDAVALDEGDRRWAIGRCSKVMSAAEIADVYAFLQSERAPGVLRRIFMEESLTGFNPKLSPPETVDKVAMTGAAMETWKANLIERMAACEPPFNRDVFTLGDVYDQHFFGGFAPSRVHLGRQLSIAPFNCESASSNGKQFRIWRNIDQWRGAPFPVIRDYYDNGTRPTGVEWSDVPPPHILQLSSLADLGDSIAAPDAVESADDCSDLI